MASKIAKKLSEESGVTVLNKPSQMIGMDVSGLNKFQHDVMDVLLHNVQQNCSLGIISDWYKVNILDVLNYVSDSKDGRNLMRQNKRIEQMVDSLSSLKLLTTDKRSVSAMVIFPNIIYNRNNGDIKYRVNTDIENAFKSENKLIISGDEDISKLDLPKAYYTRIYLDTYNGDDKKDNHSLATKSMFQFICKNVYTFDKNDSNSVEISYIDFRAICGYNYDTVEILQEKNIDKKEVIKINSIDYTKPTEKYSNYRDFKKFVMNKIVKEMLDVYKIPIQFEECKFGKNVKSITLIVDTDCEEYKMLSKKMRESVDNSKRKKQPKQKIENKSNTENLNKNNKEVDIVKENNMPEISNYDSPYSVYKTSESFRFFGILKIKEDEIKVLLKSESYKSYKFLFTEFGIDNKFMVTEELYNLDYRLKIDDDRKSLFDSEYAKLSNLLKDKDRGLELAKALLNTTNYEGYKKHMMKYGLSCVLEEDFNEGYRVIEKY